MAQSKKKILIFSVYLVSKEELKGTGNWVITLLDELKKNKEFNFIFAFHDPSVKTIEFEYNNDIQFIRIPLVDNSNKFENLLLNWLILDKYKNATKNYLEIINKIQPNLIQIFGLESPFIRVINKVNQPLVIHIQGLIAPYINKFFPRFNFIEILKSRRYKNVIIWQKSS